MGNVATCPICGTSALFHAGVILNTSEVAYGGECPRCGKVRVSAAVIDRFKREQALYLLSAYFRTYPADKAPLLSSGTVDAAIAGLPMPKTVPQKLNLLLKLLANSKLSPGAPIPFDVANDYPLVFAADAREANYLINQLIARGLIEHASAHKTFHVNASGYERVERLAAESYKSHRNAFVAMWFDSSRKTIYTEAIEPAIVKAGYHPIRIDRVEHVGRIDDEIISNLRQSRFLVADFTGQRGGVYYEAGFMHGLGRNVFWMVAKTELEQTHFDVRQYNFIDYADAVDAKDRLYYRIMAVEGAGPEARINAA